MEETFAEKMLLGVVVVCKIAKVYSILYNFSKTLTAKVYSS